MGHDEDQYFVTTSVQDELNRISSVTPQAQSAGGDIILNNVPKKKNNKFFIVIIVAILVILGTVIATVLLANKKENDPGIKNASSSKSAFNAFYNYLVSNTESSEDISAEDFKKNSAYLEKNPNENNLKYLTTLDEKYQAFVSEYGKTSGNIIPEDVYPYYFGYFRTVLGASQINIIKIYKEEGLENAQKYIYDAIKPLGDANKTNAELDDYVRLRREEMALQVSLVPYVEASGCIGENYAVKEGCVIKDDENSIVIRNRIFELNDAREEKAEMMQLRARSQMKDLYNEIYEIKTANSGVAE